jgi:hypothetical protein
MTEQEKEKFIERLNDINKDYADGIEYKDCYGNTYGIRQTREEAGLQELIMLIKDIINTL